MTEAMHDNLSDEALVDHIKELEGEADLIDKKIKRAKNTLLERKKSEISLALKQKAEPFGAVSQVIGAYKVVFTTPKKAKYDQKGLAGLYADIAADPQENVSNYIAVEYKVSEEAYNNWPDYIKETFQQFRTVEAGNVSIKIEPVKE